MTLSFSKTLTGIFLRWMITKHLIYLLRSHRCQRCCKWQLFIWVSTSIFTQAPALWSPAFLTHPFTRSLESPDYGTGHHMSVSSVASVCWSSDLKDLQQLSLSRRLSPAIFLVILYSSKRYQSCVELCRLAQVATEAALASPWQTRSCWNFTVHHVVIQPTRQSAWLHWVTKVQENIAHISSQ